MLETKSPTHHRWEDMTAEKLKGSITRRLITGDSMMIAEVRLAKGDLAGARAYLDPALQYFQSNAMSYYLAQALATQAALNEKLAAKTA